MISLQENPVAPWRQDVPTPPKTDAADDVDVLIIGSGPTGYQDEPFRYEEIQADGN